jgi:hypothetical protein
MSSNPFVLRSSETLQVTKEMAIAHRDMPASPTERTFSEQRAKKLLEAFEKGLLLPCSWAKAIWKGKEVRMNGQHSSYALCEMETFPSAMTVHMDVFEPTSEDGMALLFRQFDARLSGRSATDCSHAYQGLFPDVATFDEVKSLAAIKGINRYHRFTGEGETWSGDDIGRMYFNRSYDKFIGFMNELLSDKCKELKRDEVIAAIYGTFLTSESRAVEFWNDVKTAHKDGEASQVLDEQLEKNAQLKDLTKKLKPVSLYAICVKAWNAYLANETCPAGGWKHPKDKALPEIHSST